jgi:ABC-type glycerol-3-phosphate transport system permease component
MNSAVPSSTISSHALQPWPCCLRRLAHEVIAVNKPDMFPLPVALALLRSAYSSESYGPIVAGAALSALPLLVVFVVANRRVVEGVRLSGLKG